MAIGFLGRGLSKLWSGRATIDVVPAISTTPEVVARIVGMVLLDLGATVDVQGGQVTFTTFLLALEGSQNPLGALQSGVIDVLEFAQGIRLRVRYTAIRIWILPLVVAILGAVFVHLTGSVLLAAVGLAAIAFTRVYATNRLVHEFRLALAPEPTA